MIHLSALKDIVQQILGESLNSKDKTYLSLIYNRYIFAN